MANFKATVNVNFNISVVEFPEMQEYIKLIMETLKQADPFNQHIQVPHNLTYRPCFVGEVLEFGDKLVMDNGNIKVFPKALFDTYSKQVIALPNQAFGNVKQAYEKALNAVDPETREFLSKRQAKNLSRYNMTPMLSMVA